MGREDYLFAEGDLDATLRSLQGTIGVKIDAIPRDQFMNAQPEEIVAHILSAMTVEPLVIYEDRAEMDQRETKIDVSGWRERNPFGDRGPIHVRSAAGFATPLLTFCAKPQHPTRHKTLQTGLQIPSGLGTPSPPKWCDVQVKMRIAGYASVCSMKV